MKIDKRELQRLYQANIRRKIPATREQCPDLKELITCFRSKRSRRKNAIVEHVVNCCYCWQEFDFVLQTARAEKALLEQIEPILQASDRRHGRRWWLSLSKVSIAYASLALVGLMVFIALGVLFRTNILNPPMTEERGKGTSPILLLLPPEEERASFPLVFRWRESGRADSYVLELYDESLSLLWRSPHLAETRLRLPAEVASRLIKKKDYFWMITSFRDQEKFHESSLGKFHLRD